MAKEDLGNLGFTKNRDSGEAAERFQAVQEREAERMSGNNKEDEGFVVIKDSLRDQKTWRRPTILGAGTWSFKNPFKRVSE